MDISFLDLYRTIHISKRHLIPNTMTPEESVICKVEQFLQQSREERKAL